MVEHYHGLLWQIYSIITNKISSIEFDLAFQMYYKAINNLIGPNGLVLTLLVFCAYPRMIKRDISSLSIIQYAMTMKKAMNEILKHNVL